MLTFTTNAHEVIDGILNALASFEPGGANYDMTLRQVATTMLPVVKNRIFGEGKASDGSSIGTYSTKPMYADIGQPMGKTGRSIFTSGKKKGQNHKSHYFGNGYAGYKATTGSGQLGGVNLTLSGEFADQFVVLDTGYGWTNSEMTNRALFFEKKYGKKIFDLTDDEKAQAVAEVQNNLKI